MPMRFFAPSTSISMRARRRERQLVHRNLIALGKVRVEIILAGEARARLNRAIDGERGAHGEIERLLIEHRQGAGQAEAHGTRIRIRRVAKARRAAAERLRQRVKLRVNLEADHGFVSRHHVRRQARRFLCGSAHRERTIIASASPGRLLRAKVPRTGRPRPIWRADDSLLLPAPRVFHAHAVVVAERGIPDLVLVVLVEQVFDVGHSGYAVPQIDAICKIPANVAWIARDART